jgi:hypothetical protein
MHLAAPDQLDALAADISLRMKLQNSRGIVLPKHVAVDLVRALQAAASALTDDACRRGEG